MEQHPVPQNISSYQFRLIGDMTLRQFFLLAGGCAVALIFYALPIVGIIKWPLVMFSGFMGFALAFIPIEERPLDKWILAFVKAIFSPTQFVWKKKTQPLEIFQFSKKEEAYETKKVPLSNQDQVSEFLQTLPTSGDIIEERENDFIKKILGLFQSGNQKPQTSEFEWKKPEIKDQEKKEAKAKQTPKKAETPAPKKISKPKKQEEKKKEPETRETKTQEEMERVLRSVGAKPSSNPVEAKTSENLPFPEPINVPNTLVGMVLTNDGKIVENAIVEIRELDGLPVRALKTNALGQFRSVTPLKNGQYEIVTEKSPLKFDILKINLKGEIVEPIEIRAK